MATLNLLKNIKELDNDINEFLNNISEAGLTFQKAIKIYMAEGLCDRYEEKIREICAYENRNDQLRRHLETKLYSNTLIPESRSDVLTLLEGLDNILSIYEKVSKDFSIETPMIPETFHSRYIELTETVISAAEALVTCSRAFFVNTQKVNNSLHKVMFYEKQGDLVCEKLNREIFASSDLGLPEKSQLRKFSDNLDDVANWSEDIADKLSIFTIKRMV